MPGKTTNRLIYVDLDETMAQYDHWRGSGDIGEPIPEMVEKIKQGMAQGDQFVIFSARVNSDGSYDDTLSATESFVAIAQWCQQVFHQLLPITHEKSKHADEFWDDRGRQVIPNTGLFLTELMEAHGADGSGEPALAGRENG